jgi:GNAT superfamily N-acetyltransferase
MPKNCPAQQGWECHPVTGERWPDLVRLFEHHGNPGYCWCMSWRLTSTAYTQLDSQGRRQAFESLIQAGAPVGILGYLDNEPVGWCSIAPRETYTRLEHSTTLKRLDDQPVWSVVCFFVKRSARGRELGLELLKAAVAYARAQGAAIVEGYPVEPTRDADGNLKPVTSYRYMGSVSIFRKAGFRKAGAGAYGRPIMRLAF